MGRKAKDITGETYGRLTAVRDTGVRTYGMVWEFLCSCGNTHQAVKSEVTGGKVKSCGCAPNSGRFKKTHGHTGSPTYGSYNAMIGRCKYSHLDNYRYYKGAGVEVCERWQESFENFLSDMGERPEGCSIDRIDGTKGYFKENCRWASIDVQADNKANITQLTYQGVTQSIRKWSEVSDLSYDVIRCRYNAGWAIDDIFKIPFRGHRPRNKGIQQCQA